MDTPNRQATVDSRRIALEREVELRFPAFDNFVTEFSANISTTGMFITSDSPQAAGTTFAFEFSVADDWKLIRGKAQVVWARYKSDGPNRPPGMGVRFTELDPQSRRLIRWIVEKHIREGGKPFELDELRTVIDEALEHALEPETGPRADQPKPVAPAAAARSLRPEPPGPPPVKRSRRKPFTVQPWMVVVAVVAVIGLLIWLSEVGGRLAGRGDAEAQNGRAAVAAGTEAAPDDSGQPASGDVAADSGGASAAPSSRPGAAGSAGNGSTATATAAQPSRPDAGRIGSTVEAWAEAWSAQDADAYLSHYASDFRPTDGSSRQAWAATRRERIRRPDYIRVAISGLETEIVAPDRAEVSFFQSYKSDTFADEVRKTLVVEWRDDGWKIVAERSG